MGNELEACSRLPPFPSPANASIPWSCPMARVSCRRKGLKRVTKGRGARKACEAPCKHIPTSTVGTTPSTSLVDAMMGQGHKRRPSRGLRRRRRWTWEWRRPWRGNSAYAACRNKEQRNRYSLGPMIFLGSYRRLAVLGPISVWTYYWIKEHAASDLLLRTYVAG